MVLWALLPDGRLITTNLRSMLMNRTAWSEGVKRECERDVVGHIGQIATLLPLHDDVPNIAAAGDGMTVGRRDLPGLPFEDELAALDCALAPQQCERPGLVAPRSCLECHYPLHGLDALRQRLVVKERLLSGGVIADIRIRAVVARA